MKYLGSKQRIINDILPIMLEKIDEKQWEVYKTRDRIGLP